MICVLHNKIRMNLNSEYFIDLFDYMDKCMDASSGYNYFKNM